MSQIGESTEDFCRGTGIFFGRTFQETLDNDGFPPIFLTYFEENNIIINQIENLPYFEFRIDGRNTYTKKDIWYEIVLNYGDNHDIRTTRIRDDLLRFTLVEIIDGTEKVLFNNRKYSDLTNQKIWVDTIPANTNEEINRTYRLYMWISQDTVIGNVEEDYTIEEWNDVFASVKVSVTGDFNEKIVTPDASCFETEETTVYTINPVMKDQSFEGIEEINELTACVIYFSDYEFDYGSDALSFCKGTGTSYDMTIQQMLDEDYFYEYDLLEKNIIVLENDTYRVNPVMQNQSVNLGKNELTACVTYFTNKLGPEEEAMDEGETWEAYCRGTGTRYEHLINQSIYEGSQSRQAEFKFLVEHNIFLSESGLSIFDYDSSCGDNVIIPDLIDGKNIIMIGSRAFYESSISEVVFPETVKFIGGYSFRNNFVQSVDIPESVTYLDCDAFDSDVIINKNENLVCVSIPV